MKQAEERSRARAAAMDIQRRADIEEERRRRERQEEAYYPERKSEYLKAACRCGFSYTKQTLA